MTVARAARPSAGSSEPRARAMAVGVVRHENAVLAAADQFRNPAHITGNDSDTVSHGEQDAGAEAFGARQVNQGPGAGQVGRQIG